MTWLLGISVATLLQETNVGSERWRKSARYKLPYDATIPPSIRPIFLPEMRMMLVRIVWAEAELQSTAQSHSGDVRDAMLAGIRGMHQSIRSQNPAWLLELLEQLPEAAERPEEWARGIARDHGEAAAGAVRLSELRALAHRAGPWWI